jgi:hypothetical protein
MPCKREGPNYLAKVICIPRDLVIRFWKYASTTAPHIILKRLDLSGNRKDDLPDEREDWKIR